MSHLNSQRDEERRGETRRDEERRRDVDEIADDEFEYKRSTAYSSDL